MLDDADERILTCLDRALDILGSSVKRVTYFYLSKEEGLVPTDLIKNPRRFVNALYNFFGDGAGVIETWILRELRKEADLLIRESANLPDAVKHTKAKLTGRSIS